MGCVHLYGVTTSIINREYGNLVILEIDDKLIYDASWSKMRIVVSLSTNDVATK